MNKKLYLILISTMLLITGCKNNNKQEVQNSNICPIDPSCQIKGDHGHNEDELDSSDDESNMSSDEPSDENHNSNTCPIDPYCQIKGDHGHNENELDSSDDKSDMSSDELSDENHNSNTCPIDPYCQIKGDHGHNENELDSSDDESDMSSDELYDTIMEQNANDDYNEIHNSNTCPIDPYCEIEGDHGH